MCAELLELPPLLTHFQPDEGLVAVWPDGQVIGAAALSCAEVATITRDEAASVAAMLIAMSFFFTVICLS